MKLVSNKFKIKLFSMSARSGMTTQMFLRPVTPQSAAPVDLMVRVPWAREAFPEQDLPDFLSVGQIDFHQWPVLRRRVLALRNDFSVCLVTKSFNRIRAKCTHIINVAIIVTPQFFALKAEVIRFPSPAFSRAVDRRVLHSLIDRLPYHTGCVAPRPAHSCSVPRPP